MYVFVHCTKLFCAQCTVACISINRCVERVMRARTLLRINIHLLRIQLHNAYLIYTKSGSSVSCCSCSSLLFSLHILRVIRSKLEQQTPIFPLLFINIRDFSNDLSSLICCRPRIYKTSWLYV